MKSLSLALLVLSLLATLTCCSSHNNAILKEAERLVFSEPTMALTLLEQEGIQNMKTNKQRAKYALFQSIALDKCHIFVTSDSLVNICADYFESSKDLHYRMLSYYYKALVQKNAGAYISSVILLNKAEKDAITLNDYLYLGLIYRNIASIMNVTNNNPGAIEFNKKALDNFLMADKPLYAEYAKLSLATDYVNNQDISLAKALLDTLIDNPPSKRAQNKCKLLLCEVLSEEGYPADSINSIYQSIDSSAFHFIDWALFAESLDKAGHVLYADSVLTQAYRQSHTQADSASVAEIHARIFKHRSDSDSAFSMLDLALRAQDIKTREILQQSVSSAQKDYYKSECIMQENKAKIVSRNAILSIYVFILLSIIIGAGAMTYMKNQDNIIKEQIAQLAAHQTETEVFLSQKAMLLGTLFCERLGDLDSMADEYFAATDQYERERIFKDFKKKRNLLTKDERLFSSLERDLNAYCGNVIEKLETQLPSIKGQKKQMAILFMAGVPNITIQLIMGKQSLKAIEMDKSRLRQAISKLPDSTWYLSLMKTKKRPARSLKPDNC